MPMLPSCGRNLFHNRGFIEIVIALCMLELCRRRSVAKCVYVSVGALCIDGNV